jgi:predicted Zn-dependent protease
MTRISVIPVLLLAFVATGCAISEEKEIEIGRQSHAQFERQFGGRYPDEQIQQYTSRVGMEMARYAGRPKLPWQFAVLNSTQVNAFAVPGGWIYITQGLLFRMENEAMLAGVLGHEVAHIAHRHSVKQIQQAQTAQGLSFVAGIAGAIFGVGGLGDVTNIVASLSLMKYGRGQEKESDMSGLKYMTASGYNPQGMVQLMAVLQKSGGGGAPEFLSTHPNPGNRLEYLTGTIKKRYVQAAQTGRLGEEEFRRVVLARSTVAHGDIDWSVPSTWCGTCRDECVRAVVTAGRGGR